MSLSINADYHTHTVFSHGKGTIAENVNRAKQLGLKAIAITDHGFGQPFAGLTPKSFEEMKLQVQNLNEKDIKVLLGVEANLITMDGEVDLTKEQEQEMDIILCGYHLSATKRRIAPMFNMVLPAMFGNAGICSSAQKKKNTKAYINMIKNYKIDVVTHPGFNLLVDYKEIGKVCSDYGTYVEISTRHSVPNKQGLEELLYTSCNFIVNSDAHKIEQIGQCDYALKLVEEYKIEDRVINIGDKPLVLRSKQ